MADLDFDDTREILRRAESMKYFAEGEKFYNLGEWRAWEAACRAAGKCLPPRDFKKKVDG